VTSPVMPAYRYPTRSVVADYLRAGVGLVFTGGPIAVSGIAPGVAAVLGGFAVLFAVFGVRTAARHMTRIDLTDDGVRRLGPRPTEVRWRDLGAFSLRYYSTKRDRRDGWIQLKIAGGGRRLAIDSSLEGFADIVRLAVEAARANGVATDPATLSNLGAMGIETEDAP